MKNLRVMMLHLKTCIVTFTILSSFVNGDDPCRYSDKGNGVIDLSSVGRKDGKAAFPDSDPGLSSNYLYSYNPCKSFTEGTTCTDVAMCQVSRDKQYTFVLGKQNTAKWNPGAGAGTNPTIAYTYDVKNVFVELACTVAATGQFESLGENPTNTYKFRLTHKCACWNGCKSSESGLPGGAIFIILLLVLATVYLIGFAIYNRFRLQSRGVDLIAHRTFWVALPSHASYGVTYIFRRLTGKGGGEYKEVR